MLVVGGEATPVRSSSQTSDQRSSSTSPERMAGSGGSPVPLAVASHEQAIRHGSRIAAAPPGRRVGQSIPARSYPSSPPASSSPPQIVPSGPRPVPS